MARRGRAGDALAIAALGSFFAGCVGTLLIAAGGPPLAGRAIWWPSRVVTMDEASPGRFTRMAVVEPPYWLP